MKSFEVLDHPPPYRLRQALLRDIRAPALLITSQLILKHPCLLPDSETAGRPPCMSKINMTVGDPNSGTHTCAKSTSPTEPSPEPTPSHFHCMI